MRVGVGIVGCGTVCDVYLRNLLRFPDVDVLVCADRDPDRARSAAARHGVRRAGDPSVVLGHPDVEIVVNLTNPVAHAEITSSAICAGKHVYSEKPVALDLASGHRLMDEATAAGVRIAVAPDTTLGAGLQRAFRLIAAGAVGVPHTAVTLMQGPGPELWHPDPGFLYRTGAGPLFDMGPYNLTALASVFGPVSRTAAVSSTARAERTIASGPSSGSRFPVEVPTQYCVVLRFGGRQVADAVFSFDSPVHRFDFLEVSGSEATIALPNPNTYGGRCLLRRPHEQDWIAQDGPAPENVRGVGVLELARAVREGRPHRNGLRNALHVLETMLAIACSAERDEFVRVESGFEIPDLLPDDWDPFAHTLD